MPNQLGEFLKQERGNSSCREMAKKLGISHTYYIDLERGYDPRTKKMRNPSAKVLKQIAESYGIPFTTLLEKIGYLDK